MSNLIVVTGITGKQGSSVANAFLSSPEHWRVRGIVRNPSLPAAQAWAARGVELVCADQDDPASLITAFTGANAIFAMTDFWTPLTDPAVRAAAAAAGVDVNVYAHDLEVKRGENMARAATSPGVIDGLQRYVWSSLSAAKERSGGKYTQILHFDGKAKVERFIRQDPEMVAKGLSAKASFVQVGLYVDNWRNARYELVKEESGRFVHKGLGDGRLKLPFVWTRKDTGVVVRKVIEDVEPGKSVLAYSELITWREFMAKFKKVLGLELGGDEGIEELTYQGLKDAVAWDEAWNEEVAQSFAYFNDLSYSGADPDILHPKDIGIDHLLTPIEEYIRQEDWSALTK